MNRRDLIGGLAALSSMTVAGRVWAAPKTDARLLVVFLRGAYDAANVVIPISSDFYYASRPNLAIARPDPAVATSALSLDVNWGLHPALRDTILPLYQKGQAAFIPFAGTDDLTRSHFETQDTIELGQDVNGVRDYRSGFMARLADTLTRVRPISFTDQMPLTFQGGEPIPNIAINSVGKPGIDSRQASLIASMYDGKSLAGSVREGFRVRDDVYNAITDHMMEASRGAVSPKGFELSARRIGRLMREQFNLGFVDVGGWDTHVNQGAASGYLADRLSELGRGLAGFAEEIGPQWQETVVVVVSEFGRTFRENGNRGTDHGHGSVYWVLGGGIKGGRIAGEQIAVDQSHLFQNRDYPVLTHYRSLLGGLFQRMYGLDQNGLQRVFATVQPRDLGLV
ncbi:DUF1501 domain-containing protein (plasmid) [Phyllobacterium sp. 628]|uniref:DUF1501 domain-containing protein n=1 Tax=Phyllobacterium sp. 628 TaxID=2718938 RepID=UPI00166226AE|nr:DUF1501 domain-containing protein [Phyllobacterium sp. 628]QND55187.1 DUF1501 domain-containing protein [Phyllobacterium sp. 628]